LKELNGSQKDKDLAVQEPMEAQVSKAFHMSEIQNCNNKIKNTEASLQQVQTAFKNKTEEVNKTRRDKD